MNNGESEYSVFVVFPFLTKGPLGTDNRSMVLRNCVSEI